MIQMWRRPIQYQYQRSSIVISIIFFYDSIKTGETWEKHDILVSEIFYQVVVAMQLTILFLFCTKYSTCYKLLLPCAHTDPSSWEWISLDCRLVFVFKNGLAMLLESHAILGRYRKFMGYFWLALKSRTWWLDELSWFYTVSY